jgi:hypothetical protein
VTIGVAVGAGVAVDDPAGVGVTPGVGLSMGGSCRSEAPGAPGTVDAGSVDRAAVIPAVAAARRRRTPLGLIRNLQGGRLQTTCHVSRTDFPGRSLAGS